MKILPPELVCPAGDWCALITAVENGADAIYFGLERFNARMRAKNITQADLPALMAFLHRRGVKGYVTFNTLVQDRELRLIGTLLGRLLPGALAVFRCSFPGQVRFAIKIGCLIPAFRLPCITRQIGNGVGIFPGVVAGRAGA